jgi:hypothetical protein
VGFQPGRILSTNELSKSAESTALDEPFEGPLVAENSLSRSDTFDPKQKFRSNRISPTLKPVVHEKSMADRA